MNKNYKLYLFSLIISLLVSSLITIFIYSIGNKDNVALYSFNQEFVLDDNSFMVEMDTRMESFIKNFVIDFQNLNLKINHELRINPSFMLTSDNFQLLLDESVKVKSTDIFYDLFKEDYFINKFNKSPLIYLNEFKKDYFNKYQSDEKIFDVFKSNKIKIISLDDNIDFKNFINNKIFLSFYLETDDYENLKKVILENKIITLYLERYLINEFYNQFRDYIILYVNKKFDNTKSTIKIYETINLTSVKETTSVSENIDLKYIFTILNQIQSKITNELKNRNVLIKENFTPISIKVSSPDVLITNTGFTFISYLIFFLLNIVIIFFISLYFLKKNK